MNGKRPWTLRELALLRAHYPTGGARAVQTAGVTRTIIAIRQQASEHAIACTSDYRRYNASTLGPGNGGALPTPIGMLPTRPSRIANRLHALAETPGLTEREYEQRKASILAGEP